MELGTETINVPFPSCGGDYCYFDPDWRYHCALYIRDNPTEHIPLDIVRDKYVQDYSLYLKCSGRESDYTLPELDKYCIATNWYENHGGNDTKLFLEPLLLTDQPINILAQDLGTLPEYIFAYEKIFFDCGRENTQHDIPKLSLRTKALYTGINPLDAQNANPPQMCKYIGAFGGYDDIIRTFNWDKGAHGVMTTELSSIPEKLLKQVYSTISKRIMQDNISSRDAGDITNALIAHKRLEHDMNQDNNSDDAALNETEMFHALKNLLQQFTPKKIDPDKYSHDLEDVKAMNNKSLQESSENGINTIAEDTDAQLAEIAKISEQGEEDK